MCSVRKHEKWLLIENDGVQEVVNLKRVINSAATELAIGSKVTFAGTADENNKIGIILAAARDSRTLERLVESKSQEQSEQVNKTAEEDPAADDLEGGDFSSTASSWEPSADSSSSDTEEDEIKPNMRIRQFFNKNGKVMTPSYRVNAVVSNGVTKNKSNPKPPVKKRKRTLSDTNGVKTPVIRTVPDSSKSNNNPASDVQLINEITKIDKCFKDIFKMLKQWKSCDVSSNGSTKSQEQNIENHAPKSPRPKTYRNNNNNNCTMINSTPKLRNSVPSPRMRVLAPRNRVPTPPKRISTPSRELTPSKKHSRTPTPQKLDLPKIIKYETQINDPESDTEEYKSDESNRSDDNILISNKYTTVANENSPKVSNVDQKKDEEKSEWIPIGSGATRIHKYQYSKVNWKSYTVATRTLLLAVFPRKILATHSLTGKRSPAFQNLPPKMCLDPRIVQDVIMEIQDRFHIKENLIRTIITTKCADECKMMKIQQQKRNSVTANTKKIISIKSENLANQTC